MYSESFDYFLEENPVCIYQTSNFAKYANRFDSLGVIWSLTFVVLKIKIFSSSSLKVKIKIFQASSTFSIGSRKHHLRKKTDDPILYSFAIRLVEREIAISNNGMSTKYAARWEDSANWQWKHCKRGFAGLRARKTNYIGETIIYFLFTFSTEPFR